MNRHHPKEVEDYTNAFLVTTGGILFMFFWVLATLAGALWVAAVALGLNRCITWLGRRRMTR